MVSTRFLSVAAILLFGVCTVTTADNLYFPGADAGWAHVSPAEAGWDAAALDAALAFARERNSSSVVILLKGRILAEAEWKPAASPRYTRMQTGKTTDGRAIEDVASVQKSVVSFLAAVAVEKGLLDLNAPADRYLGEGWSKAPREREAAITIRHLMSMTSGLNDALDYQQPAGTAWRYNTGAYSRMIGVLEKAAGRGIHELTREWLTSPIRMSDTKWVPRRFAAATDAANSIGLATTSRDLARFGLMVLANGKWDGRKLLKNPELLKNTLVPSQELNPSYGLLWWLNGQESVTRGARGRGRPGSMIPSAPDDLVAAQGALGRKCYVVPSLGLVVTRLGDEPGEDFNEEFWKRLMNAAPASN